MKILLYFVHFDQTIGYLKLMDLVQHTRGLDVLVHVNQLLISRKTIISVAVIDERHVGQVDTKEGQTGCDRALEPVTVFGKVTLGVCGAVDGVPHGAVFTRDVIPGAFETNDAGRVQGGSDGHQCVVVVEMQTGLRHTSEREREKKKRSTYVAYFDPIFQQVRSFLDIHLIQHTVRDPTGDLCTLLDHRLHMHRLTLFLFEALADDLKGLDLTEQAVLEQGDLTGEFDGFDVQQVDQAEVVLGQGLFDHVSGGFAHDTGGIDGVVVKEREVGKDRAVMLAGFFGHGRCLAWGLLGCELKKHERELGMTEGLLTVLWIS